MGFSIKGYVLEPPRVGQSNSPFTSTPNNFVSNSGAYNAAYPSTETNPRTDYLTIVTSEGSPPDNDGLLTHAKFGWTKNEVIRRFDYIGKEQRFKPLPGGVIAFATDPSGKPTPLGPNSNTQRLKVPPPLQALPAAPFRLSIGTVGSGITQNVNLVLTDGDFGSPTPGTTELSLASGNLNWNATDLTTYGGQQVRFQQQAFFDYDKSTGNLGLINAPVLLLNPVPGTGQFPLIRIGYGFWFQSVEVPNEGSFTTPPLGTVQWALDTGRLHFNPGDVTAHAGTPVYYDGVLFARDLPLPTQSIGTVTAPSSIVGLPPVGGDLVFWLPGHLPYTQFAQIIYTTTFDPIGVANQVQVNPGTGAVQFSLSDRTTYGSAPVSVTFGDLAVDHGISLRFFRSPVDLDGSQKGSIKDVTAIYNVTNAVLASPIIQAPQVFLPSVPIDDPGYPLTIVVEQGQGTFTGTLPRLDVPSPPPGLGYYIDFDARTFHYAQRRNNVVLPLLVPSGSTALPNPLLLPGNVVLELETGTGTNIYTTLTPDVDVVLDPISGVVTFATTQGVSKAVGSAATFSGFVFTDATADFITDGVQAGDFLVVETSAAKGIYTIVSVNGATQLTTDVVAQTPSLSGPPTPVSVSNVGYEVLRSKEVLADRFFQQVVLIDPSTKVERITAIGTRQNQTQIVPISGPGTFPDFLTLTDPAVDFIVSGVQIGDSIELHGGPDVGSYRRIVAVAQHSLTVANTYPFITLTSALYSVERRLSIPVSAIGSSRIRFGPQGALFSTVMNVVPTDAAFSNPITLPAGTVEVSQTTGNLNFSADNLIGPPVTFFWVHKLTLNVDYKLQPGLGLVQFTNRMLAFEEAYITYTPAPPTTDPPTPPGPPVSEYATFLVRKEVVQAHPTPTNTLHFNPTQRTVAPAPSQAVFRGGRPQQLGVQCDVDAASSTVTFFPDNQVTDALPHGAIIAPNERVYVDYYVYEAIGGELTTSVLQPPMLTAQVLITAGTNSFTVHGDQTAAFPAGFLMRIDNAEIHRIASSAYNTGPDQTTITIGPAETFGDNYSNPPVFVTSGQIRTAPAFSFPSYFVSELQSFDSIARGMNKMKVYGDRTSSYRTGVVVRFTDGLASFVDYNQVTGAEFDEDTNKTTVTFLFNATRQYVHGTQILSYTARPIFEPGTTTVQTSRVPIPAEPLVVFRRTEGEAGLLLSAPTDYQIDTSGTVKFAAPLQAAEEFSIFYTGHRIVPAGPNLRVSYTCQIVPDQVNGMAGQILKASYSIFSPDSFYYRVETLTNFKGEVAQEIQAAAQSGTPSTGPMTSNSSSPQLFQQGRESVFFQEGHLFNEDIVARASLKFFNDAINFLEDALHSIDGRVVGDNSGRFIFDGVVGRKIVGFPPVGVLNQIDDLIAVSPFPLPNGTYQQIYLQGPYSRFFKTRRNIFTTSPAQIGGSPSDDDVIAKYTYDHLTSLPSTTYKRWPRAQIQFDYPAGTTTFVVDNASGTNDALQRPAFITSMRVVIQDAAGTFYINDAAHVTVTGVLASPERLVLSAGPAVPVPAGATIYVSPSDANSMLNDGADPPPAPSANGAYMMLYPFGKDVNANLDTGELLYIKRKFPFDGTLPTLLIPKFFYIYPVQPGDILQADGAGVNVTSTTPDKFPALFGGTTNDDRDQSVPIKGPTFDGELTAAGGGPLNVEIVAETPVTGTWRTNTTPPYVGTGSLNVAKTIISDVAVYSAPLPQVGDIVRILTGLNGATDFRRIIAVGVSSVTVDSPFTVQDFSFTYTIAVSATTVTGTATLAGTTLTDAVGTFLTSVKVGWTIVMTSGVNLYERRQIVAILSNTQLTLDFAFPSPLVGGTYRADNALDTYGGASGSVQSQVSSALATELATISTNPNSEQNALFNFFSAVFTTLITSGTGTVLIANLAQLVDSGQTFITAGINTSHLVYVTSGTEAGIYEIASVDSQTQITVNPPFPAPSGGFTYQIVSTFGVTTKTLQDLFSIITANQTFITQTQAFQSTVDTPVAVLLAGVPSANTFARGLLTTDLDNRYPIASGRTTYLTGTAITKVQKALASTDRLYDKRFAWIDARINLEKGYLVQEQRAAANRIKTQADIVNQLIKLLTVQGS